MLFSHSTELLKRKQIAALLGLLLSVFFLASETWANEEPAPKPKIILVCIDGADYSLMKRFMDAGQLPHMQKISETGTFAPLSTTNPAQSPVALSTLISGLNPGKTNIGGFIKRGFMGNLICPMLATIEESYQGQPHQAPSSLFPCCQNNLEHLPEKIPFPYNLRQGETLWEILSRHDRRSVVLSAPQVYPPVATEGVNLLSGLNTPDVNGGPGTWFIYSSETFTFFDRSTNTGGKVYRLDEGEGDTHHGRLYGPTNFCQRTRFLEKIDRLEKCLQETDLTPLARKTTQNTLRATEEEYSDWRNDEYSRKATIPFLVAPDFNERHLLLKIQGQQIVIKEGEWSDWIQVHFELSRFLQIPALFRLRLIKCADDEIRFFVPAIGVDPSSPPEFTPTCSPAAYSADLVSRVGLFDTVGWDICTHALKDEEISEEIFLEDVAFTLDTRERLFEDQLGRKDWDALLAFFSTVDRTQHMMYRLFDEQHPSHDAEQAKKLAPFLGRDLPLKDSIPRIYQEMDRIIGSVAERLDKGEFGPEAMLMVVSDHGVAPFYRGVGINNFLIENGFLTTLPDPSGEPQTFKELVETGRDNYLMMVDWSKTEAYSLGLGKIFINLKGREPDGTVTPSKYQAVCDRIIETLEALVDPTTGDKVVSKVYRRHEIFQGAFWKEGPCTLEFYGPDGKRFQEDRETEGFADLYVGFKPKYRVSWQTSLGGVEENVIVDNNQTWSADHVSVDPMEVPGILLCTKKISENRALSIYDIVPTILDRLNVEIPECLDGETIRMKNP